MSKMINQMHRLPAESDREIHSLSGIGAELEVDMLRVLVINDFKTGGGAEEVARNTVCLLDKHADVRFFFGSERYERARSVLAYIFNWRSFRRLLKELRAFRPQIVHLHNYYHYLSPSVLAALVWYRRRNGGAALRIFYTAHDYHLVCPSSGFFRFVSGRYETIKGIYSFWGHGHTRLDIRGTKHSLLKFIQWWTAYRLLRLFRCFDAVISPSWFLAGKIKEMYPKMCIDVIRNPLYWIPCDPLPQSSLLEGGKLRLLFLGRVSREKGLREFLEGMRVAEDAVERLDVMGDGPNEAEFHGHAKAIGLADRVHFLGRVEHDQAMLRLRDYHALVLPSVWVENAPLVLVEAAMQGLRLLTSEFGGMREMGELLQGAYYFDPFDRDSVARAVRECAGAVARCETIERDYGALSDEFSPDGYLERLLTLYRSSESREVSGGESDGHRV